MTLSVPCPTCGKQVLWRQVSTWRPFCSKRCQLIDLGDWLDETHRISDGPEEPDSEHPATPWDQPDSSEGRLPN
jgi:endogenous inhibitor of DNA gyrase (YacG/DUF329 family)